MAIRTEPIRVTYNERIRPATAGQIATLQVSFDADSYVVEGSEDLPFGGAVQRGSSPNTCKPGVGYAIDGTENTPTSFLGIAVRDPSQLGVGAYQVGESIDKYRTGAVAGVVYRGDVYVPVYGNIVASNDLVTWQASTGRFGQQNAAAPDTASRRRIFGGRGIQHETLSQLQTRFQSDEASDRQIDLNIGGTDTGTVADQTDNTNMGTLDAIATLVLGVITPLTTTAPSLATTTLTYDSDEDRFILTYPNDLAADDVGVYPTGSVAEALGLTASHSNAAEHQD